MTYVKPLDETGGIAPTKHRGFPCIVPCDENPIHTSYREQPIHAVPNTIDITIKSENVYRVQKKVEN
jgi:hypothetical protein